VDVQAPNNRLSPLVGTVVSLTGSPVPFNTSLAQTAADIVSLINLIGGSVGYTAKNTGATISVYAPAAFGNVTFNLTVITTGNITTTAGGGITTQFVLTVTPASLDIHESASISSGWGKVVFGVMSSSTSGATGAVSFLWEETNPNGGALTAGAESGISMSSTTAPTVTFSKFLSVVGSSSANVSIIGYFKCTATDAGTGRKASKLFAVKLNLFAVKR
jgi:hypothetical protein